MENEVISIRLMQTRSLEHLWNSQKRVSELTFHEMQELLTTKIVEVRFFRRDDDQVTGRQQQRLVILVNGHISIEIRCRTFIYEFDAERSIELFAIGGIREIITPCWNNGQMIVYKCNIKLLDWKTIKNVCSNGNIEKELIESISKMDVSYAIESDEDVCLVRQYLESRQNTDDMDVLKVIHAFNRIVNPEKYRSK